MPLTAPLSSDPSRVCRCYKHLEKCEHHIATHEVKYQLHNMDTRTLFHCNCTRRCVSRRKRQGFFQPSQSTVCRLFGVRRGGARWGAHPGQQLLTTALLCCRLARCLRRARNLSDVEVAVLADHIAMDCFVLELPTDCSLGERPQHK